MYIQIPTSHLDPDGVYLLTAEKAMELFRLGVVWCYIQSSVEPLPIEGWTAYKVRNVARMMNIFEHAQCLTSK